MSDPEETPAGEGWTRVEINRADVQARYRSQTPLPGGLKRSPGTEVARLADQVEALQQAHEALSALVAAEAEAATLATEGGWHQLMARVTALDHALGRNVMELAWLRERVEALESRHETKLEGQ